MSKSKNLTDNDEVFKILKQFTIECVHGGDFDQGNTVEDTLSILKTWWNKEKNKYTTHIDNINSVMVDFLKMKAKEHKCKPSDLNIGYYDGDVYLYKTYYDKYHETKVSWEQDLNTGEIIKSD
jgi:hypothetical protein